MTPTTPTPGAEPHQPGEREALEKALADIEYLLRMQSGKESDYAPGAYAAHDWWRTVLSPVVRDLRAALAHLAERRAGDVEAVAKVLNARLDVIDRARDNRSRTDPVSPGEIVAYLRAAVKDDAAQIAALTPTRGVSAETHTEWGVRYVVDWPNPRYGDDGTRVQKVDMERHARTAVGQEIPRSGHGHTLVRREVTDWREVRGDDQ